jgi:hypothetical protein
MIRERTDVERLRGILGCNGHDLNQLAMKIVDLEYLFTAHGPFVNHKQWALTDISSIRAG